MEQLSGGDSTRNARNSPQISLLAGIVRPETGSQQTRSTATESISFGKTDGRAECRPDGQLHADWNFQRGQAQRDFLSADADFDEEQPNLLLCLSSGTEGDFDGLCQEMAESCDRMLGPVVGRPAGQDLENG